MPTSTAPDDTARLRRAVQAALREPPVADDAAMRMLRDAAIGTPALVHSPDGAAAFWLVPLQVGQVACGYARLDLSARVLQLARFGAGAADLAGCPEADFFERPPPRLCDEVRAAYPGQPAGAALLSYDGSPAKWAWLLGLGVPVSTWVYIGPGAWYARPAAALQAPGREG